MKVISINLKTGKKKIIEAQRVQYRTNGKLVVFRKKKGIETYLPTEFRHISIE